MMDLWHDWLSFFLRWAHLIAGISWIGSSFYFVWLDGALVAPEKSKEGVEGELWMVHSGGFYQVEKRKITPGQMPKTLHWFKWEAAFTWISGIFLLGIVYYSGDGALLLDLSHPSMGYSAAVLVSLSLIPLSWLIYDGLWNSPLGKNTKIATSLSLFLLSALSYGLCQIFTGRAAYVLVAAGWGTIRVANVWMRILPFQRKMIQATQEGKPADFSLGTAAKRRSMHNSYVTLPVLFLMLSNHYPMTYGHEKNWILLLLLFVLGAAVRHSMIAKNWGGLSSLFLIPGALLTLGGMTLRTPQVEPEIDLSSSAPIIVDLSQSGTINGNVLFEGEAPLPKKIAATPECVSKQGAALYDKSVLVLNKRLQNVFVWISQGLEGQKFPIPSVGVELDQHDCAYHPRVVGVQVEQELSFLNSDSFLHNVHALAKENIPFNQSLVSKNLRIKKRFTKPEIMIHSKCDIHPWMSAYIGVVPHPYFAVSNVTGEFSLEKVPPGTYLLEAWHERYGRKQQSISLGAKETKSLSFSFP